jgi:hypothetical protein
VDQQLQQIKGQADADFNRFKQIMTFSADVNNAASVRSSLLDQVNKAYDASFVVLWQFVAFSVAKATDSSVLEGRARAVLQAIEDKAEILSGDLIRRNTEAQGILDHIKKVAGEQGVSQQAHFFKDRADEHGKESVFWRTTTLIIAIVIIVFATFSAFAFKISWMRPENNLDAVEFLTGKILVFLTFAALFALSAKNFLAHKHNSILNRHRQTALQTYRVLVDAGSSAGSQDIVLAQAAACIFGQQDTGFSKEGAESPGGRSVLELLTKSVVSGGSV